MKTEPKVFKGPDWMREPLPEGDRVKYVPRNEVLKRLGEGEKIRFWPDSWGKVPPRIHFEKDDRLLSIRRITFEAIKKIGLIEPDQPSSYKLQIWSTRR